MSHKNNITEEDLRRALKHGHKHDQRAKNQELRDVGSRHVHRLFGVLKRFPEATVIGSVIAVLAALPPIGVGSTLIAFVLVTGYLAFRESRSRQPNKAETGTLKAEPASVELVDSLRAQLSDTPVDGVRLFELMDPTTRSASEVQKVYRAIKAAEATPAS